MLVAGGFFTVVEGRWPWVAGVLVLRDACWSRRSSRCFYRHARLFSGPFELGTAVPLFALVCCVLALTAFERHVRFLADNSWWEIVLSSERAELGCGSRSRSPSCSALVAIWRLIRPGRVTWLPWTAETRERLGAMDRRRCRCGPTGSCLGEAERAAIPFRAAATCCSASATRSALDSDKVSAIWRLRDLARQEGLDPGVWSAGPGC